MGDCLGRHGVAGCGHGHWPLCLHAHLAHDAGRRRARSGGGELAGQRQLPGLFGRCAAVHVAAMAVDALSKSAVLGFFAAGARRPADDRGAHAGHGLAGGAGLAAAAVFSGRHQRGGVCLHLGLVPVAAGQLGRAGHGRIYLHGAWCRHCVERLGRQRHGRGALDGSRRLAGVWCAGFCTECAGLALLARRQRAPAAAGCTQP